METSKNLPEAIFPKGQNKAEFFKANIERHLQNNISFPVRLEAITIKERASATGNKFKVFVYTVKVFYNSENLEENIDIFGSFSVDALKEYAKQLGLKPGQKVTDLIGKFGLSTIGSTEAGIKYSKYLKLVDDTNQLKDFLKVADETGYII